MINTTDQVADDFFKLSNFNFHKQKKEEDIAVIGIALKTSLAKNVDEFWSNISQGKDCIHSIPDSRQRETDKIFSHLYKINLDEKTKMDKKRYLNAGYLEDIEFFDYRFFRLSPREASLMDPAQRKFMEVAYEVFEDAGYAGEKIHKYKTGVFVGYSDDVKLSYFQILSQVDPSSIPNAIAGNLSSVVPSRISYFLDLKGPSLLIDTACSSSLVAIHMACQAIHNDDCEQAIVGGVRFNLMPISYSAKVGIESSDGRTKSFDDDSDGTGSGEGAAAVLLKPLSQALKDNDHIYAIIKGSAVNQDGQSMGITAPSVDAQKEVVIKAWKNAKVEPESISFIEAHATGTKVGDPIEFEGIKNAFEEFTSKKQFCAVGSVKTIIGHLFEASGIFSFIKAALCLKYQMLTPNLHFNRPNRNIPFEDSPFYVCSELKDWVKKPLRCGVTAFGFSGTNCHIVLEEAPKAIVQPMEQPIAPYILTLSAKSKNSLINLTKKYIDFLQKNETVDLHLLCFTANTGRFHFNHRLGVIFDTRVELLNHLNKIFSTNLELKDGNIFYNEVHTLDKNNTKDNSTDSVIANGMNLAEHSIKSEIHLQSGHPLLNELVQSYLAGKDIDWDILYHGLNLSKISLPTYAFDNTRCWLEIPEYVENAAKQLEGKFFFNSEWIEADLIQNPKELAPGAILVFKDECKLGNELIASLRINNQRVVEINFGDHFIKKSNHEYQITPTEEGFEKLLFMLEGETISTIFFMSPLTDPESFPTLKHLQMQQKRGVISLFNLFKMILKHYVSDKIEFVIIADYVTKVTGDEPLLKPENACIFGLANSLTREAEHLAFRCLDIDTKTTINDILHEIQTEKEARIIAFRNHTRYCEKFSVLNIDEIPDEPVTIKDQGVYLITGGTGGIGLEVCKYLAAKQVGVNLALINRSPLPPHSEWDEILVNQYDKNHSKVKELTEIENLGAKIHLYHMDVSDEIAIKTMLNDLHEKFGNINGIIHGAGVVGEGILFRKKEEKFMNVLKPKVDGTFIIDQLTQQDNLDFFVLFSSVATFLMSPGQTDYTAANSFLDSYSFLNNKKGRRTVAMNWVSWKETGMAMNFNANYDTIFKAISTKQAIDAFDKVLNKKIERIVIGELNLGSKMINLLKNSDFRLSDQIQNIFDDSDNIKKGYTNPKSNQKIIRVKLKGREDGNYTKSELLVAKIWGEVLGFNEINLDDNFYDLGGDSILATQIVSRMNDSNIKVSLTEMYNYETIRKIAKYIKNPEKPITPILP